PLSINVDYDFTLSESIMDPSGELLDRTLFSVSASSGPIIDVDPIGQTVCEGDTVTFEVQASGTGMLTYQWRQDGIDLPGETDSALTIDLANMSDQGDYDVVVTDEAGCSAISNSATLVVEACGSIGACCFPDDICLEAIDAADCELIDGRYLGDGSTCDEDEDGDGVIGCDDLCLGTPPGTPVDEDGCPTIGACCFADVGVCLDGLDEDTCVGIDGDYVGGGSFCDDPDTCPPICEGDANGDGIVDPLDSGFVLARFGCPVGTGDPSCDAADQNGDGVVDPLDAGFVLARFGDCP
ncbi:MAG: immunoglobulin domain-containing protein, partial [Planctomycetes bacterium]|nr:immunoglobulin domain-containing protein [Planctomycetota bacterium]